MLHLKQETDETIDVLDLKAGQLAILISPDRHKGRIVQRYYVALVAIGLPSNDGWSAYFNNAKRGEMHCKPLKTGDILTYTEESKTVAEWKGFE